MSDRMLEGLEMICVIVKRQKFELEVWRKKRLPPSRWEKIATAPIAIGAKGYATPPGFYPVMARAKNPDWLMPHSDWVPKELQGTIVKGNDPRNPIKAAFIKLTEDGVGIHGTDDLNSLGTKASHGCIRVRPQFAEWLRKRIRKKEPVVII